MAFILTNHKFMKEITVTEFGKAMENLKIHSINTLEISITIFTKGKDSF